MNKESKICPICRNEFTYEDCKKKYGESYRKAWWNRKINCPECKEMSTSERYKKQLLREHNLLDDNGNGFEIKGKITDMTDGIIHGATINNKKWHPEGYNGHKDEIEQYQAEILVWENKYNTLMDFSKKQENRFLSDKNEIMIKCGQLESKLESILQKQKEPQIKRVGEVVIPKEDTKKCLRCNRYKPIDYFHKNQNWCKSCKNKYMENYNKKNYVLQTFPESKVSKTRKGYTILTYITKNPIYQEIVDQISSFTNKWIPVKEFKNIFEKEFPNLKLSSLQKQMRCYKTYFIKEKGYRIKTDYNDDKTYSILFYKKLDRPISNGTQKDSLPLTNSGVKDKRSIKDHWNDFRLRKK